MFQVACFAQVHRHPPLLTGEGDRSRLFEVIDTPGFIPVSPSERVRKKRLSAQQQQQLQERIGTASRVRQLPLELFFDLNYPRLSADELALLAAFRMLPESCLFTIEEAAVALGEAFFRVGEQLPAATDVKRLLTRYQLHSLALDKSSNMGLQLVLKVRRLGDGVLAVIKLKVSRMLRSTETNFRRRPLQGLIEEANLSLLCVMFCCSSQSSATTAIQAPLLRGF